MRFCLPFIALLLLATAAQAQPVQWDFRQPLGAPRTGLAAAALDGYIYVAGGADALGTVLASAARYDPTTDQWEALPPMEHARVHAAAVVLDGRLYVIGGRGADGRVRDDVEVFDPAGGGWRDFEDLDEERQGLTAVVRDGALFVAGGSNDDEELLDTIEFFDQTNNQWVEFEEEEDDGGDDDGGDPTLGPLEFCASSVDLNTGDVVRIRDYLQLQDDPGGEIDYSLVLFTYTGFGADDPTTPPDWNLSAFNAGEAVTITAADGAPGTGNQGDGEYRVYVARQGEAVFDDHLTFRVDDDRDSEVDEAKCSNQQATAKHAPPVRLGTPRASFAAVPVGETVLYLGGFSRLGPLDLVQQLQADGTFAFLTPLPTPRGGLAAAALRDTVYVAGGRDARDQVLADVQRYDAASDRWRPMPRLNVAREAAAAVALDGTLYVLGGRDATGRVLASVEAFGDMPLATDRDEAPGAFAASLEPVYPNPAYGPTTIRFHTAGREAVHLAVYDVRGRQVALLVDSSLPAGEHRLAWDAAAGGAPLPSGVYLVRLRQGTHVAHQTLVILR